MLLNDFGEYVVFEIFERVRPIISFKVVFPQLPVIEIIFASIFSLNSEEHLLKKSRVLSTLICLESEYFLFNRFTIAKLDFFLKTSDKNLFPSVFLPFIAKKISFFFIVFEFIEIFLILELFEIFDPDNSLIIFNFKFFDKDLFFSFIDL